MAKISYVQNLQLSKANKERLTVINDIIEEYLADDLVLTLRQLYYQLVTKLVIPNKKEEYARLSTLLRIDTIIREHFIRLSAEWNEKLKKYLKDKLYTLGYTFNDDVEFMSFCKQYVHRVSRINVPEYYEFYLVMDAATKGVFIGSYSSKTNFTFDGTTVTLTMG